DAFAEREHRVLRSSPLVPANDPTLFFTNAGMVQFKDVFTGVEKRDYVRATTVQKCLRVSGKHNDLENVGRTPRHHTFFEMLGNFSFGDYFKSEACAWAWEILTKDFALDPERLWVTVFEEDDEAYDIWVNEVGVPKERVQRLGEADNFWSMGPTGPCGPCSEIFWDHGPSVSDDTRGPAGEDDRYVEIWNLVFMQYEQYEDGRREPLPSPSIDTGAGLERIAAIKQGVYSNYDTDGFMPLIQCAGELAGVNIGTDEESDVALRVIADHSRATAFLIADGVMPSNEERGYVLRRIMRRAIRYGVKLGLKEPFLYKTVDAVVDLMADAYPDLAERRDFISEIVRTEEERFSETLEKGLALLEKEFESVTDNILLGDVVFRLYDTFGFPVDLTRLIAEERGIALDESGYEAAMEAQRAAGRAAWKGSGETRLPDLALPEDLEGTEFTGYAQNRDSSEIVAIAVDAALAETITAGQAGVIATMRSPFYAEAGGQVGDKGTITTEGGVFRVVDVQKGQGDVTLHLGEVESGTLKAGETSELSIDEAHRAATRLNHTATHLLHAALQEVLGDHVAQKGSLVDPVRLRFDFAHHKPMTPEELRAVENCVYQQIMKNEIVETDEKDLDTARADGAQALFGEKYGESVRVVSIGEFSMELCGGTHASASGDIGLFRITSESGIAAGVRRIEAVTGEGAMEWIRSRDDAATQSAQQLRSTIVDLPGALERLLADKKRLEKELDAARRELARNAAGDLLDKAREINGIRILAAEVPGDASMLRDEADRARSKLKSVLVVLGSRSEGSVQLVAAATPDLVKRGVHAGNIIRDVAKIVGGGGGGRPDMAQAGGRNPDALPGALEKVFELVESQESLGA
ncbi:MAG: alanine--tRNA ligase, partial [Myxococcota bacterium]|nr:alanine--tRNA ligase [Myxococcota bacterium]